MTPDIVFKLLLARVVLADLSCKDMDGNDVDWFVALKIPNMRDPKYATLSELIKYGQAFYYADANNQEFRISKRSINDSQSAIGATVSQAIEAFKSKIKDQMYIFYNDQPPNKKEFRDKAHSKGLMNFDNKQGFWLVHSAPNFNDPTVGHYVYPGTSMRFGQAFMCGTFLSDQLTEISKQIFVSHFGVYQKNLPEEMARKYPRLYHLLKMDKTIDNKCPYSRNAALRTKGGTWMTSYEKNKLAQSDLYTNQILKAQNKSMYVETWLNGPNQDWKNYCEDNFVKNIRFVRNAQDNIDWPSELDHSKWAVTDQPSTVCIGDINRQKSQKNRGGGTLCLNDEKIWTFFRDLVSGVECCPSEKKGCELSPSDSVDSPLDEAKPGSAKRKFFFG